MNFPKLREIEMAIFLVDQLIELTINDSVTENTVMKQKFKV